MRVNIALEAKRLSRLYDSLSKQQVAKATSMAINKTLLNGRTEARTAVKKVYNIPQRYLNGIGIVRSKPSFLEGYVTASSKPIPMDAFAPRFDSTTSGGSTSVMSISRKGAVRSRQLKSTRRNQGVTIEVIKGKREVVPYAFMIPGAKPRVFARGEYKGGNGSYGFMQRHTRQENDNGNDAVKPLVSVTVHGAVLNRRVRTAIGQKMQAKFSSNMESALRYLVSKS